MAFTDKECDPALPTFQPASHCGKISLRHWSTCGRMEGPMEGQMRFSTTSVKSFGSPLVFHSLSTQERISGRASKYSRIPPGVVSHA
jgi:hypothetical protein